MQNQIMMISKVSLRLAWIGFIGLIPAVGMAENNNPSGSYNCTDPSACSTSPCVHKGHTWIYIQCLGRDIDVGATGSNPQKAVVIKCNPPTPQ
ncbi:MAG: hypothetical protein AAF699_22015 [Pseudomonadota bacterium]